MNVERIAGEQISGLDSNELDFLVDLLGCNDDNSVFNQWTGLQEGVVFDDSCHLNEMQLQEIEDIEKEAKSQNTERQTRNYIKLLKNFLMESNLPQNIEDMPIRYLESYMRLFFAKIRKKDGQCYSVSSLVCMRAAFHRYICEKRHLEVIGNPSFCALDKTFKASVSCSLKGREKRISEGGSGFSSIDKDDMEKLRHYFNRSTPQRLQDEVFFILIYHFGFRGREWLRSLNKSSLMICESGTETYVDLIHSVKEKNVKVGDEKSVRQIIMTEIPNKDQCPVAAVKLYLSKLPGNILFPKCKVNWEPESWYCKNQPLGKNSLNDMMKSISKRAQLNAKYTNHCIRSTVVTTLKRSGFDEEACMAVTGHKSRASIERYDKRKAAEKMTFSEKKKISEALSEGFDINSTYHRQSMTNLNLSVPCVSTSYAETISINGNTSIISGPSTKSMKVVADGEKNIVTISFV